MIAIIVALCSMLLVTCGGDKITVEAQSNPSTISNIKSTLNVFIENSGSMDGYMCDGSQLKDAIFDYVSDLNAYTDATKLYYINNDTIPYRGSLEQYIKTMNAATFQKAGGNRSNSDIGKMIAEVLKKTNDSTICLFVSDCILDLPVAEPQKFLSTCQISIKNAINECRKRLPNLGVEILKMTSDFEGKYFYPNGGFELLTDVKRPYYIWIFGNSDIIAKLIKEVPISGLEKYGLEGVVSYSKERSIPYDITNKSLTNKIINPIKGDYKATIRADFSSTLQPETVLQNPSNYAFNNRTLIIEEVGPITAGGSIYTHYINICIPKGTKIAQDNLILQSPKMPDWVSQSNDDTGKDIKNNLNKTTGIQYLIGGVADAYKKDKVLTTLKFSVKRK